ncbi:MAG: hypothetical protein KKF62_17425 [Bacteroidetes bacterium]|nr:hypothetical protein [Bacteroidota bacterium]MBU1115410.1 hypothetical protein [Bacteroidota bacterium]MBU1797931.1 hypothetical protein [Bacteroidota bacterium]
MKRVFYLLVVILLVVGASLNAQPQNGRGNGMGMGFGSGDRLDGGCGFKAPFERMEANLKLTDDQVAKISDLRFKHENLVIETQNEIQKNRLVVRKMMTDNKIDQKELLKLTSNNSELQAKIKLSRTTMWLDVYNLLDDTQKEQWTKTFNMSAHRDGKFNRKNGNNDCNRFPRGRK